MGFDPGILIHRDEVSPDGSVKRSEREFSKSNGINSDRPSGGVSSMFRKMQPEFDACGGKNGAIDGTRLTVDFNISAAGHVTVAYCRPPFTSTPLAACILKVLGQGKVKPSGDDRNDMYRTIVLHPDDP